MLYSCFTFSALLAVAIYLFVYRRVLKTFPQNAPDPVRSF
jgi:hypothetical protein